jgi:restriction endonuclease S subunit
MQKKLALVATIQTGIYTKTVQEGDAIYLQSRHLNELGQIDQGLTPDLYLDEKIEKYSLREGDVLFPAKGTRNVSGVYQTRMGRAVASTSLFVIRIKNELLDDIRPEYLSWFLNHPRTQEFLKAQAKGASPPSISIRTLYDLNIQIPTRATQQEIVRIHSLRIRENELTQKIAELKERLLQYRLYHSTNI